VHVFRPSHLVVAIATIGARALSARSPISSRPRAGATSLALGALLLTRSEMPASVGVASAGIGGLSLVLAARATHRHRVLVGRQRDLERARRIDAAVAPMIDAQDGGRAGMMLSVRY